MAPLPGAWKTFASILGILLLGAMLSPIPSLDPFLPWITLVLVIWVFTRKRVVHKGTIDIPTAPGEEVILTQSSVKFYVADTMWRRTGGGAGVHLGRRFGRKWYGGLSAWNSDSKARKVEYFQKYYGGAMLTDRRLLLVDGVSMTTRLTIPIRNIASFSMTRRDRITLSWGASSLKTVVLQFTSLQRAEALESAARWFNACRRLTSEMKPTQQTALQESLPVVHL